jgi:hypothetical protein
VGSLTGRYHRRPAAWFIAPPGAAMNAQVALTLRMLGGLTTDEIARAFSSANRRWPSGSCGPRAGRHPVRAAVAGRAHARRRTRRAGIFNRVHRHLARTGRAPTPERRCGWADARRLAPGEAEARLVA